MPGPYGLPRSARLLAGKQFSHVFEQRRSHGNDYFRIHYAPASASRLGIAVSRRVSNRAVVRNLIKRQVRESFRHRRASIASMDYVVIARPPAAKLDSGELRTAIDQLWQRFE